MAKVSKKIKFSGRPTGAPNKSNVFVRDQELKWRCSEGFIQVLDELKKETGKSKNDILHEALQQYAYRQPVTKSLQLWITKI